MTQYIQSIQQFTCTIAASATSNTATISSVNAANAFILLQGDRTTEAASMASARARAALTNGTTVTVTRNTAASSTVTVQGLVIELTAAALNSSVQTGTIALSGVSSNTATISAVGANAFVVHLGQITNSTSATNVYTASALIELTNSTTVTARRGASADATTVGYAVIDPVAGTAFLNSAPQPRSVTRADASATFTDTISSVSTSNTLLIRNGFFTSSSTRATGLYALQLTGATSVTMTRNAAGASTSRTIAYTVLEFASGVLNSAIQRGATSLSATPTDSTISPISTSWGGVNHTGLYSGTTNTDSMFATVKQLDATTIRAECDAASVSNTVGWEAFEFVRPPATFSDSISASVAAGDALTGGLVYASSLSESLAPAEAIAAAMVRSVTLADSTSLSDSLAAVASFVASLSASVGAGDSILGGLSFADGISATMAPADAVADPTILVALSLAEGIGLSDEVDLLFAALFVLFFDPKALFTITGLDRPDPSGPAVLALGDGGNLVTELGGSILLK